MVVLPLLYVLVVGALAQDFIRETQTGRQGGFVALRCGFSGVIWFKNLNGEQTDVTTLR